MATNLKEVEDFLKEAQQFIRSAQNLLNYPIMATPTGARREKITEANIHLGIAETALSDLNLTSATPRSESNENSEED